MIIYFNEMNQLPNYMGVSLLILTLFALLIIYQFAGVRWKTRPWIPLVIGVVLLLSAYAATLTINGHMKRTIAVGEEMAKRAKFKDQEVFKTFAISDEYQLKLLELVTIPLAVSMIASALFARGDRAFQAKTVEYEERIAALYEQKTELEQEDHSLLEDLISGARGQSVIDRFKAIVEKHHRLCDAHWDVLDDFRDLLQTRLVRRVNLFERRSSWRDKR